MIHLGWHKFIVGAFAFGYPIYIMFSLLSIEVRTMKWRILTEALIFLMPIIFYILCAVVFDAMYVPKRSQYDLMLSLQGQYRFETIYAIRGMVFLGMGIFYISRLILWAIKTLRKS